MQNKCENCEYARRAENEDYVGCIKVLIEKENYTDENVLFNFYNKNSISIGWVNLGKYPEDNKKEGMITNYIPCFLKEDICEHYLSRRISND
jgi:hypothetical protein